MAELTVDDLHLTYGDNPILKGVSLTLKRGEVVSLLGPSGSGKTTLLRAVAGLETPHQGTIRIGDKVVFDGAAHRGLQRRGLLVAQDQPSPELPQGSRAALGGPVHLQDHLRAAVEQPALHERSDSA